MFRKTALVYILTMVIFGLAVTKSPAQPHCPKKIRIVVWAPFSGWGGITKDADLALIGEVKAENSQWRSSSLEYYQDETNGGTVGSCTASNFLGLDSISGITMVSSHGLGSPYACLLAVTCATEAEAVVWASSVPNGLTVAGPLSSFGPNSVYAVNADLVFFNFWWKENHNANMAIVFLGWCQSAVLSAYTGGKTVFSYLNNSTEDMVESDVKGIFGRMNGGNRDADANGKLIFHRLSHEAFNDYMLDDPDSEGFFQYAGGGSTLAPTTLSFWPPDKSVQAVAAHGTYYGIFSCDGFINFTDYAATDALTFTTNNCTVSNVRWEGARAIRFDWTPGTGCYQVVVHADHTKIVGQYGGQYLNGDGKPGEEDVVWSFSGS